MSQHDRTLPRAATSEVALSARGLTKTFGAFTAIDDVTFEVARGTIHGLIGPNGAGKSTLFGLLTKFLTPTAGKIHLGGEDITRAKPEEVVRRGMVRSFQISAVFPHLTLRENIRVALQRKHGMDVQFWQPTRRLSVLDDRVDALLDQVNLLDLGDQRASDVSYGRKRSLELATTLALDPQVMLLDEPMAGMASADIGAIAELIRRAAQDRTVLMVEHNLDVVDDLCDRVTVLARGAVLAEGSFEEIRANQEVRESYMGAGHE
ncbi:amino acid ABC transporter ATP-binding protein [Loktanella sp. 3ANDIMAR09]|uniref:ABC transporter ATP-binding protein n=1 Tax=Loktanella sp. 3ANDIMAR09 TaxID=1225657 RepID=UPI0006FFFF4A|nr:ABC transporter ATP-binding protein [Loktanella sp. 3ANDIMAR09]KQI68778.1 amino acid ABC transporter ATP-binding protein [Loktanella sp. 3ANDIMAR09]